MEPALLQVWLLVTTWWMKANWSIASPYYIDDESLPDGFSRLALEQMRDLPVGIPVDFKRFADRMIKESDMVWDSPNKANARQVLSCVIERTLVNILAEFGILQKEYVPHENLGGEFQQLSTFQITSFGRGLLEAIHSALERES
jgi:hypothetical protein